MTSRRNRLTTLAGTATMLTVGLSPVLFANPAQAAESKATAAVEAIDEIQYEFTYVGGAGLRNQIDLRLSETAETYIYTVDDIVEVEAGAGCTHPDSNDLSKVSCEFPKKATFPAAGTVKAGDGNDVVSYTNLAATDITAIYLGAGNDTYVATRPEANDATIFGEADDDNITIGSQTIATGAAGNDVITLIGGAAAANGGDGNDQINGGVGNDRLLGEAGDDIIYGNDGDDHITGGAGHDELYGGRHNDELYGNSGDDTIYGNSGDDYISGGAGSDTISGGTGDNTVVDV